MTNNLILVGRIVKTPELRKTESGTSVSNVTLAIPRPFKNQEGNYDTDFIECTLWNSIAKTTCEFCEKGDLIAVKGRIQSSTLDKEDMPKINILQVIAEKISFLTNTKNKKVSEEQTEE